MQAMRLALRGGFAAMTVRQIAREAQVAAGRLHHHFTSIGELKRRFFIALIRECSTCRWWLRTPAGATLVLDDRQRGWPTGTLYPPVARRQVDGDPDIKAAYLLTMKCGMPRPSPSSRASPAANSTKPSNT